MPFLEELSVWTCPYCSKKNDHTNWTRCWNCNKKKPTKSIMKRILNKRKREEASKKEQARKEIISRIDNTEPENTIPLTFDTSKLKID